MLKKLFVFAVTIFSFIINAYAFELEVVSNTEYYISYNNKRSNFNFFQVKNNGDILFSMSPDQNMNSFDLKYKYFDYNIFLDIERKTLDDIQDLLFIGYTSDEQKDINRYALVQYILWQQLGYEVDVVNSIGVSIKELYYKDYNEIINRLNKYKTYPSYFEGNIDINYGEKYLLNDLNNVEDEYELIPYSNIRIEDSDSGKNLYGRTPIKSKLACMRKDIGAEKNKVYYSNNMFFLNINSFSKRQYMIEVNIHGGKIKIKNVDSENDPIADTTYEIYNKDNTLILKLVTNINGEAITPYLPYDEYYIVENGINANYVSNKEKINVQFVDYSTAELVIKSNLITDESELKELENDSNTEIKEEIEVEKETNSEENSVINEVGDNDELIIGEIEENVNQGNDQNIIELLVPDTKLNLTIYIIVVSLMILFIGLKYYVKK